MPHLHGPGEYQHGQQGQPREVGGLRVDEELLPVHRVGERSAQKTEHDDREGHEYAGDAEVERGAGEVEDQEAE